MSWRAFLVSAGGVLTLGFALLQPEASNGLSFVPSIVFWAAHVFSALILLELAQVVLSQTRVSRWPTGLQLVLGGALGAAAFGPVALGLDALSGVGGATDDVEEGTIAGVLGEWSGSAGVLVLTWVALNSIRMLRLPEFTLPKVEPEIPLFWKKVPPDLGRDIVSLQAEQHYTRVRTVKGDCLILHPFGDAAGQLDPTTGQQVHRSFWAAYGHIVCLERVGQSGVATLSDGSTVKVSRKHMSAIKARL